MTTDKVLRKYVHDKSRVMEWFWYSYAYLDAAKQLAVAYQSRGNSGGPGSSDPMIIAPLIYNLRHGLELLLKFFWFGMSDAPSEIPTHDISKIFAKVRQGFEALDEESLIFAAEGLGQDRNLISKYLKIMTDKMEELTRKYYGYEFLSDDKRSIEDPQHVLFRYPSSTERVGAFDPAESSRKLPPAEVLEDIDTLINFLFVHFLMFAKKDDGKHFFKDIGVDDSANGPSNNALESGCSSSAPQRGR